MLYVLGALYGLAATGTFLALLRRGRHDPAESKLPWQVTAMLAMLWPMLAFMWVRGRLGSHG